MPGSCKRMRVGPEGRGRGSNAERHYGRKERNEGGV